MAQTLPELTHAEVLRRIQREVDRFGGQAPACRAWKISEPFLSEILYEKKNPGPKLLKALGLRRVTLVVHRYEESRPGKKRMETVRTPSRGDLTTRVEPD